MKKIAILPIMLFASVSLFAQPRLSKDNIDEVLKAMTLEEKARIVVGSGWGSMVGGITGGTEVLVSGAAGTTQDIERLGIPNTVLSDGPAGLRINPTRSDDSKTYYCTGFPIGTLLASSWDVDNVQMVTSAMGNEVKEYGADVLLAPGMNLHRNPLNGRNFEYFSEDPLLSGKIAAAYVNGIQSNGVGVSVKHFACNNQETNRMHNDSRVNPRALRELYLKGFEICIKEAAPWTVMSSYNKINGQFTQQSRDLLTTILRDEWGYNGIVMTDWTMPRQTVEQIKAGNDLMEPGDEKQSKELVDAVKIGQLNEADLDVCVRRVLEYIVKTPRFSGYKYSDNPNLKAHAEVARKGAAEGMILLENRGNTLPMKDVKKVALYGVASYDIIAGGTGSGNVNKAYVTSLDEGLKNAGYEIDPKLSDYYHKYIDYGNARIDNENTDESNVLLGREILKEMPIGRNFINTNVSDNDIAVITIGRQAGEGKDRTEDSDFNLSPDELDLIRNVTEAYHLSGKKVVVVLNIGGVIETASWKHIPDAILLAWQPGQEGGNAIADVLSGKVNPSGKLPMTFPVAYIDHPSSCNFPYYTISKPSDDFGKTDPIKNYDYTIYEEGIWVGYRYFDTARKDVSYPFGYGLSYTTFAYSKPVVKVAGDGTVTASVAVRNTGSVAGREAVQLYISAPDGGLVKPAKELKAFAKTKLLQPGESETLTMTVDPYSLASYNEDNVEWEMASGSYVASFGASVEDIRATASFKESKAKTWKTNAVLLPQEKITEIEVGE